MTLVADAMQAEIGGIFCSHMLDFSSETDFIYLLFFSVFQRLS